MITIQTSAAGWASPDDPGADELTFVYKSLVDDFAIITRIEPPASGTAATGGLSVRAGLGPSDAAVSLVVSASGQLLLHNRRVAGAMNESWLIGAASYGSWLKLERRGTVITAFHSLDGTQWTSVGRGTVPEARTVTAGMVAASGNPHAMLQVLATGFRTERLSALPAGWNAVWVGAARRFNGAISYRTGAYTIFNSSGSIGDLLDRFGFIYLRVTGDAEIVARVMAPGSTAGSEAGVMARESLDPDAAYAFAGVAGPGSRVTKRRIGAGLPTSAGLSTSLVAMGTVSPGWWLKLVRRGPLVTTFESSDGAAWTPLASDLLPLPETFFLGLAFASGSGVTAQGVFDQVFVRARAANEPSLVPIVTPKAPTSLDPDPTAATSPGGAPTTPPISIPEEIPPLVPSIPPPAPAPATLWHLEFAPSPDHDQTVDRYVLQVLKDDLNSVGIELDLGHPVVSNGICAVDVSQAVATLTAGNYVFSVRALDADTGLFSSAVTTTFTR